GTGHKAAQVCRNRWVVPDQLGKFGLHAAVCLKRAVLSFIDECLRGMEGYQIGGAPGVFSQISLQHPETSHQHVSGGVQKLRGFWPQRITPSRLISRMIGVRRL